MRACWILFVVLSLSAACGSESGSSGVRVDTSGDPIVLSTAEASLEVGRSPLQITLRAPDGSIRTRSHAGEALSYATTAGRVVSDEVTAVSSSADGARLTVRGSDGLDATVDIRFLTSRTAVIEFTPPEPAGVTGIGAAWGSPADERIYGLTERLRDSRLLAGGEIPVEDVRPVEVGSLDRRGERVEMFIRPTQSLYAPFYQSSRGYGVFVGGTMPGVYDLAATDARVVRFDFEAGQRAENRRLQMYLIAGPGHDAILDEYTALTGRPLIPPDWAFLNWRWRGELEKGPSGTLDGVEINAQVAEDVKMFEAHGIPAGVYLFDRPVLEGNFGFARFVWDEERLPNTASMMASLRRRGFRLMTWSSTWMCGSEANDNGLAALNFGFLAPGPAGTPNCADVGGASFILDVTSAAARDWYADRLAGFLRATDLDGVKLDRGEEHIPSTASDVWADGRNGREVHNDYVDLQTTLHYDALRAARPNGDFVLFTRSGYAGTQRHAVFWGGDTAGSEFFGVGPGTDLGLRSAIIAQQRAAFLGFPIWGSDTGGYYEFKDRELFARWIEFSCFSGLMEIGGVGNHAPWDMPTDPRVDEEMIEIYRRYTQLRARLQPYIVRAAAAAARGLPLVRPMPFLDPTDPALADLWDQYLFGPDLLVAPLWRSGARERSVYLPAGVWRSLWEPSELWRGPSTITVAAPLDVIPVFVRSDASSPLS